MSEKIMLFGQEITVSAGLKNYAAVRALCSKASYEASERVYDYILNNVHSVSGLLEKHDALANYAVGPAADSIINFYLNNGVYTVAKEDIICYVQSHPSYTKSFDDLYEEYLSIVEDAEAAREYREARKENRGRWVGGGFGVKGAIKGAAMAETANLATGLFHSLVNSIEDNISDRRRDRELEELFEDYDTKKNIANGIKSAVLSYFDEMTKKLGSEGFAIATVSSTDSKEAKNILSHYNNPSLNDAVKKDMLIKAFGKDPLNGTIYDYLFNNYGAEERKTAIKLAKSFGVDMEDIIDDYLSTDKIPSDYKGAAEHKKNLLAKMSELGITESSALAETDKAINKAAEKEYKDKIDKAYESKDVAKIAALLEESQILEIDSKAKKSINEHACEKVSEYYSDAAENAETPESLSSLRSEVSASILNDDEKEELFNDIDSYADGIKADVYYGRIKEASAENNIKEIEAIVAEVKGSDLFEESIKDIEKKALDSISEYYSDAAENAKTPEAISSLRSEVSASILNDDEKEELLDSLKSRDIELRTVDGIVFDNHNEVNEYNKFRERVQTLASDKDFKNAKNSIDTGNYSNVLKEAMHKHLRSLLLNVILPDIERSAEDELHVIQERIAKYDFDNDEKLQLDSAFETRLSALIENNINEAKDSDALSKIVKRIDESTLTKDSKKALYEKANKKEAEFPISYDELCKKLYKIAYSPLAFDSLLRPPYVKGHSNFEKAVAKAAKKFARYSSDDKPVVVYDDTIFGSGANGFLITLQKMYVRKNMEEPVCFDIRNVTVAPEGKKLYASANGRKACIFIATTGDEIRDKITIIEFNRLINKAIELIKNCKTE